METLAAFVRRNTWVIVLAAIICSLIFPQFGIQLKPYLNYLLSLLMFLSCLDLRLREIIQSLSDYPRQFLALLIIHLVSPLIVFLLKGYFSDEIFLGLIIATTIPAGRSAVFLSHIFGGVPIKALVVSSLSNALSPVLVPSLVWLLAKTSIRIDPLQMGSTIVYLVVVPLILAVLFGKTKSGQKLNRYSPSLSTVILFLIILGIISPIKTVISQNLILTLELTLFVSLLIVIDFFLGFLLKKSPSEKITYALTASYKNYTLATILSLTLFTPIVALPAIAYTIANNLLLIPLQLFLSQNPPVHHHRYRNLTLLIFGVFLTLVLAHDHAFINLLLHFPFPYLTAVLAGILLSSTFTLTTGALILFHLSRFLNPLLLIASTGLGAVLCDLIIFLLVKDKVANHITPVYQQILHHSHFKKILHTHCFAWTLPVLGTLIIASSFPDELGISLLGLSQITVRRFLLISAASHAIGITSLLAATRLF